MLTELNKSPRGTHNRNLHSDVCMTLTVHKISLRGFNFHYNRLLRGL